MGSGRPFYHPVYIDDLRGRLPAGPRASRRPWARPSSWRGRATCRRASWPRSSRGIPGDASCPSASRRGPSNWPGRSARPCAFPSASTRPLHRRRVDFWVKSRAFSIDKARRLLGYAPRVDLDEGIARTAAAYRAGGMAVSDRAARMRAPGRRDRSWRRSSCVSICPRPPRASSGATARPTTPWRAAWPRTWTCAYEARDLFRTRREFPAGPQGIFLKRTAGGLRLRPGPWLPLAAPGAAGTRTTGSSLRRRWPIPWPRRPSCGSSARTASCLLNVVASSAALWARATASSGRGRVRSVALLAALALFACTVTPLYLLWPTPEMFNLGLIAAGSRSRPASSAPGRGAPRGRDVLKALQPPRWPCLSGARRSSLAAARGRSFVAALRRVRAAGGAARGHCRLLFALNCALTGEINYQGGERKTFYGLFPFDERADGAKVTFGNSGIWMTTDSSVPLVEGARRDAGVGAHGAAAAAGGAAGLVPAQPRLLLGRAFRRRARLFPAGARGRRSSSCSRGRAPPRAGSRWPPSWSPGSSTSGYPGQLVRRRGHGGQPLLPEPASPGRLPRPAGREWWVAGAGVVSLAASSSGPSSARRSALAASRASTPRAGAVPPPAAPS